MAEEAGGAGNVRDARANSAAGATGGQYGTAVAVQRVAAIRYPTRYGLREAEALTAHDRLGELRIIRRQSLRPRL